MPRPEPRNDEPMAEDAAAAPLPALTPRSEVIEFLLARRSRPARTLAPDRPDDATLATILAAATRVPDHGMLTPWRFLLIERAAMPALARAARARMTARGSDAGAAEKAAAQFTMGGVIVGVVCTPVASEKIPDWEQHLSAGAVCTMLLTAALALGWGANWLTGPLARDGVFLADSLGLAAGETIAGFVHIGAETVSPAERRRPDPSALVTRIGADQ